MAASTERALAESLKNLLSKKTLNKITVKDITDSCGVNRQTFYYHFHDVYDLVEWMFTQAAQEYISTGLSTENRKNVLMGVLDDLVGERQFILNTYHSLDRRQLDQFMQRLIRPALVTFAAEAAEKKDVGREDIDFVADMCTYALVGIITEWVASSLTDNYSGTLEKLLVATNGILDFAFDNLSEKG